MVYFCSVWTVDLAYLLHKFSVNFSFFTVTIGANPQYSAETFYRVGIATCCCSDSSDICFNNVFKIINVIGAIARRHWSSGWAVWQSTWCWNQYSSTLTKQTSQNYLFHVLLVLVLSFCNLWFFSAQIHQCVWYCFSNLIWALHCNCSSG